MNTLTVLTSGQDITSSIRPYNGKLLVSVSETGTYLVQFTVNKISDLEMIQQELKKMGLTAYKVDACVDPTQELGLE